MIFIHFKRCLCKLTAPCVRKIRHGSRMDPKWCLAYNYRFHGVAQALMVVTFPIWPMKHLNGPFQIEPHLQKTGWDPVTNGFTALTCTTTMYSRALIIVELAKVNRTR